MSALCTMLVIVEGLSCPLLPADPMIPLTEAQFYAVLERTGWPEEVWSQAAAVADCESNRTPGAHRPGAWHYGLFQINWWAGVNPPTYPGWSDWLREVHGFEGDPLDPLINAGAALRIWQHSGWSNWAYCNPNNR